MHTQHHVDQCGNIVDINSVVVKYVSAVSANGVALAQHVSDQCGNIVDVYALVVVHVAKSIAVTVLEEGNLLAIAPCALSTVEVEGLNTIQEGT